MKVFILFSSILCLMGTALNAQFSSLSPRTSLKQEVGNTEVTINFERPAARGRKIYGGLVPWNKVWRTGAGHCTKIGFDRDIIMSGQPVMAGKYSLFTIPGKEEWVVILNSDTTLYGEGHYDAGKDIIRFRVPAAKAGRFYEALSLDLDVTPDNARMYISWTDVQISFPIETSTEEEAFAYIDSLLQAPVNTEVSYAWPAEYLLLKRKNLNTVIALADRELSFEESEYAWRLKIEAYQYLGYVDKALEALETVTALVKKKYADNPAELKPTLQYWAEVSAKLIDQK